VSNAFGYALVAALGNVVGALAVTRTLERLLAEVLEDPSRNTRDYLLSRV